MHFRGDGLYPTLHSLLTVAKKGNACWSQDKAKSIWPKRKKTHIMLHLLFAICLILASVSFVFATMSDLEQSEWNRPLFTVDTRLFFNFKKVKKIEDYLHWSVKITTLWLWVPISCTAHLGQVPSVPQCFKSQSFFFYYLNFPFSLSICKNLCNLTVGKYIIHGAK